MNNPNETQARRILDEVRDAYTTWQREHALEDYPPAETLFALPVPEVIRWLVFIQANLQTHRLYPAMQDLLRGVLVELAALGYQAGQDD